jgi:hypothetical protein
MLGTKAREAQACSLSPLEILEIFAQATVFWLGGTKA